MDILRPLPPYSLHHLHHHQCQHGWANQTHVGPAAVCANLAHYEIFSNMIFIWANRFLASVIWHDVTGGQILKPRILFLIWKTSRYFNWTQTHKPCNQSTSGPRNDESVPPSLISPAVAQPPVPSVEAVAAGDGVAGVSRWTGAGRHMVDHLTERYQHINTVCQHCSMDQHCHCLSTHPAVGVVATGPYAGVPAVVVLAGEAGAAVAVQVALPVVVVAVVVGVVAVVVRLGQRGHGGQQGDNHHTGGSHLAWAHHGGWSVVMLFIRAGNNGPQKFYNYGEDPYYLRNGK